MKIPKSFTQDPEFSSEAGQQIYGFFDRVRKEIEKRVGIPEGPERFRVEIYGMHCPPASTALGLKTALSNNQAHMLIYVTREMQDRLVASVLERRDEGNFVEYSFASYLGQIDKDEL